MRRIVSSVVLFGVLLICSGSSIFAQLTTATITGTVADSTGALVPGAKVTAINSATHYTRTVETNSSGDFRLEFLPIGDYKISISAAGFETINDQNLTLNLNAEVHFDAKLKPGQADQTVTVEASDVPLVQTTTGTMGRVIDNVEVDNLPLVDRQPYQLLTLTAGVQSNVTSYALGYPQQAVYINGGYDNGSASVSYYLDGGVNMTMLRNTGNVLPNPDALQEFSVQTNNYNALYGRMSAGIVNVVTKSGTNTVHGSMFEFFRDTNMSAIPAYSLSKGPLHRHDFGATMGGPLVIPHVYNGKDRTFFFGSYGGLRQITSSVYNTALVPTVAEFNSGFTDFSDRTPTSSTGALSPTGNCGANYTLSAGDSAAGNFVICNPLTLKPLYTGTTLNKGLIPDPVAVNVMNYLVKTGAVVPGGNLGCNGNACKMENIVPASFNEDEFLLKLDHNLNSSQRLEASYFMSVGNQVSLPSSTLHWATQLYTYRQQDFNLSDTWTLSPNKINQAWITYTRMMGGRNQNPALSLASFGSAYTPQGNPDLPQLAVSNYFTLANAIGGPEAGTDFYSFRDVFNWNKGKHSLSFGGEAALNKDVQQTLLDNYGVFSFAASKTARSGVILSDFLYGLPSKIEQDSPVTALDDDFFYGLFFQDDYKILPHLTLNLGVRWDIQTPPTDPHNREDEFIQGQQSTVVPTAPLGLNFPGDAGVAGRGIVSTRLHHIAPRLGFAWDVFGNGKTAVRGAAGLFYGMVSGNEWNQQSNFLPFAQRYTFPSTDYGPNTTAKPAAEATLSNPYAALPNGGADPFPYVYSPSAPYPAALEPSSVSGIDPKFQWPYTYQTNFSIQQQMGHDFSLTISYVGSSSHDLPFINDINAPATGVTGATTSNVDSRRPILGGTAYEQIYALQSHQRAHYNGLQVVVEKRMSKSLSLKGYYAWSNTIDSMQVQGTTPQPSPLPQDYNAIWEERGRADDDYRSMSVTSIVWKPNYFSGNRYLHAVADGWTLSGVVTFRSGAPWTAVTGVDTNLDGQTNDRASLVPGVSMTPTTQFNRHTSGSLYFNPAAFCAAGSTLTAAQGGGICPGTGPGGLDGNSRRNGYSGPGYRSADASLFRDFAIHDRIKFQVRGDATNVFNLVNLNNPSGTLSSALVGTISSAAAMRVIQIGGRILF